MIKSRIFPEECVGELIFWEWDIEYFHKLEGDIVANIYVDVKVSDSYNNYESIENIDKKEEIRKIIEKWR